MSKRRLLPEDCYDYWAYDTRDGERGPTRDTLAEARKDARAMRRRLKKPPRLWFPHYVEVGVAINEQKVLAYIARNRVQKPYVLW
jgi:hypothetical protein